MALRRFILAMPILSKMQLHQFNLACAFRIFTKLVKMMKIVKTMNWCTFKRTYVYTQTKVNQELKSEEEQKEWKTYMQKEIKEEGGEKKQENLEEGKEEKGRG